MKTSEAVRRLREKFEREYADLRESHDSMLVSFEKACNAGMIDDVEPDGPPPSDMMEVRCGHCGKTLRGPVYSKEDDWLLSHMSKCSSR